MKFLISISIPFVLFLSSFSTPLSRPKLVLIVPPNTPLKFDEFHRLPYAQEKKRLENFATQLKAKERAKGFVFIYEGPKGNIEEIKAHACRAMEYLIRRLRTDPKRIFATAGIVANRPDAKLTVELWMGPDEMPDHVFTVNLDSRKQEPITVAGYEVREKCRRLPPARRLKS